MSDETPEGSKKTRKQPVIGPIAQFATFGRSETAESPEVQTTRLSDIQSVKMSEVEQSKSPIREDTSMPAISTAKTPNVKKSKHPEWKQQTVYLPPSLIKWLRVQAPKEEREISEIVEDALKMYRDRMG